MIKNALHILLFALLGLFALSACTRTDDDMPGPGTGDEVLVLFNLEVPGFTSRALLTSDEELIETIDVLVFVQQGGEYQYSYRREGDLDPVTQKNFEVTLFSNTANQTLVILANARDEVQQATLQKGDELKSALAKITFTSPGEWPAKNNGGGADDFRAFPMCGIPNPILLSSGTTPVPITVELRRALARVNVSLSTDVGNFQLKTAQIFNRVTRGYVGYDQTRWNNSQAWVPLNSSDKPYKTYEPSFEYEVDGNGTITNQIYILESLGVSLGDYRESTALVVGGTYISAPGATPVTRYYRIDLTPNGLLGATGIDVVRKNSYNVEILKVETEGAQSAIDAYKGIVTLKATVNGWKDNNNAVIVDGQHYLRLSQKKVVIGSGAVDLTVNVTTDHPDGITFNKGMVNGNWCTVTETAIPNGYAVRIRATDFTVLENPEDPYRWSGIQVYAGNMGYLLEVVQSFTPWLSSNDLVVAGYSAAGAAGGAAYAFTVVSPESRWTISSVSDSNNILVNPDRLLRLTGGDNTKISFYLKSTAVSGQAATLTFTDQAGINSNKSLTINVSN